MRPSMAASSSDVLSAASLGGVFSPAVPSRSRPYLHACVQVAFPCAAAPLSFFSLLFSSAAVLLLLVRASPFVLLLHTGILLVLLRSRILLLLLCAVSCFCCSDPESFSCCFVDAPFQRTCSAAIKNIGLPDQCFKLFFPLVYVTICSVHAPFQRRCYCDHMLFRFGLSAHVYISMRNDRLCRSAVKAEMLSSSCYAFEFRL